MQSLLSTSLLAAGAVWFYYVSIVSFSDHLMYSEGGLMRNDIIRNPALGRWWLGPARTAGIEPVANPAY